jgi:hypothetical protein
MTQVTLDKRTEVERATGYGGEAAVSVRFVSTETPTLTQSVVRGLTERAALALAVQLIQAVGGQA